MGIVAIGESSDRIAEDLDQRLRDVLIVVEKPIRSSR
jgi:hypothetical protein